MKQKKYSPLFLALVLSFVGVSAVYADTASTPASEPTKEPEPIITVQEVTPTSPTYTLTIRYQDSIVYDDTLSIPDDVTISYHESGSENTATTTISEPTALALLASADDVSDAFAISDLAYYPAYSSYLLNCLSLESTDGCYNWQYVVDGTYPSAGMDQYTLEDGDHVYLYFGERYSIEPTASTFYKGVDTVSAVLNEYNYETNEFAPATDNSLSLVLLDASSTAVNAGVLDDSQDGLYTFSTDTPGDYSIGLDNGWSWYWPLSPVSIELPTRLTIRYQDNIIYDNTLTLDTAATITYHNVATTTTSTVERNDQSVLHALATADEASEAFSLSDIAYYDSFGSYIISCITIEETAACDNWQYTVNGDYPFLGMDQYIIPKDEVTHIYLYFGERYGIETEKNSFELGESVTSTLNEYDFENNVYKPATDTTLVMALLDSSSTPLATSTISEEGIIIFTPTSTGSYKLGLDNGWSWYWPVTSFEVTTVQEEAPTGGSGGGGCGSCGSSTNTQVDTVVKNIINFLDASQNEDGSFGSSISFSDWTALAYNAYTGSATGKDALKTHLLTDPDPRDGFNDTASYAKRAMVLMSYGINPYTGTNTNYIQKIVEGFDGTQFGIDGIINDDIFSLMPLLHAGYTNTDPMIVSSTKYILSQQSADGKFESKDLTGAALQILPALTNIEGVTDAIAKAKTYLLNGQQADGGFGDIYATPWIMQGLSAQNLDISTIKQNNLSAIDYLKANQDADGGIGETTNSLRLWTSAWAVPALLEKPWPTLLSSFSKPAETPASGGGSTVSDEETTTSTEDVMEEDTTTSTEVLVEEESESATPEVTILPITTTEVAIPTLYEETTAAEPTVVPNVAGVKIDESSKKDEIVPKQQKEEATPQPESTQQIERSKETPESEGTKPVHVAFGVTIALGLLLGWRFLRTLL